MGNCRKFKCSVTLTLTLDQVKVMSTYTVRVAHYLLAQSCDCSVTHYRNMAIWISSNIDIGRSLNSRDSFPRWKFKNRAPTSCSPGPILWPSTISFELHAEMAEEIDLEKCTFRNFGSSVTLTLTLDRVEVTVVCICGQGLPTHEIRWKLEKLFVDVRTDGRTYGRTDTPEFQSTRSSPRRWTKNESNLWWLTSKCKFVEGAKMHKFWGSCDYHKNSLNHVPAATQYFTRYLTLPYLRGEQSE